MKALQIMFLFVENKIVKAFAVGADGKMTMKEEENNADETIEFNLSLSRILV